MDSDTVHQDLSVKGDKPLLPREAKVSESSVSEFASMSLSAGADPRADPPTFDVSQMSTKKPSSDNPWVEEQDNASQQAKSQNPGANETSQASGETNKKYFIVREDSGTEYDLPKLGHAVARHWAFRRGFLNLNNGV